MATNSGFFYDLLVEEYKKNPQNIDVVGEKRKKFEAMLIKAHSELKQQNFAIAKHNYFDIIEHLKNEPYIDELNLLPDTEFCIKCCFCYSSIMDSTYFQEKSIIITLTEDLVKILQEEYSQRLFPKYLNVLLSLKKKDWVMTLYWCNAIEKYKESDETDLKSIDFFNELLPAQCEINVKVKMYEEEAFYGYGQKLSNLLWCMPEIDKRNNSYYDDNFRPEYPQYNDLTKTKKYFLIKKDPIVTMKQDKIKLEKILNKCMQLYQTICESSCIDSFEDVIIGKITEIEDLAKTKGKKKKKDETIGVKQTQTNKIKSVNKFIQTEGVKYKNAEVQVKSESQVLNTLLDIKSQLLVNQEKKEDIIKKLNRTNNQLHDKLIKEVNKRNATEEEFEERLNKHQFEKKVLEKKVSAYVDVLKQEHEKNVSLHRLLVEQINYNYNISKNMYKTFEKKSEFMIKYLKEINQFLTPNSIPNNAVVNQNIDIWDNDLKKAQENLNQLDIFYNIIKMDMNDLGQFNVAWPKFQKFPRDEENIVFISFKPAIKRILDIEGNLFNKFRSSNQSQTQQSSYMSQTVQYNRQQLQYPLQNSSFFVGARLVYPNMPPPIPLAVNNPPQQWPILPREGVTVEANKQRQQSCTERKPHKNFKKSMETKNRTNDKEIKVCPDYVENHNEKVTAGESSTKCFPKDDKNYQEREKILFEYVIENCPGATEAEVTLAILDVLDENKGTLSKLSKDKVVEAVKIVLRKKKPWIMPKSPHDWKNDHSDDNCSICFEEFSVGVTYTLPCQHQYHKACIKKWLETSSVCPICRVHSVIDEDFPPLH